jgi:hypothetical protein
VTTTIENQGSYYLDTHEIFIASLHETVHWIDMSVKKAKPQILSDCQEVFKVNVNLMSEYTEGIYQLLQAAHITSSLALLRSLIETSVNLQWITKNPQENAVIYLEDRMPSIQKRFNQVGYQHEYTSTYVFLNKRTHGNYDSSFDCRKTSIRKSEVVPSISNCSIQRVFVVSDGCYCIEEDVHMTKRELYRSWASFICGKSLDYILSTFLIVFGENVRSNKWWNSKIENILVKIIDDSKDNAGFVWNHTNTMTELILD